MFDDCPCFESGVVAANANENYSYPCSVIQMPDGRLITSFTISGKYGCVSYSADGGRNWGEPDILFSNDGPFVMQQDTLQNFADPCAVRFRDRLVMYCVSLKRSTRLDLSATRIWYRESYDSGLSWNPIQELKMHKKYVCGTTNAGLRLADGSVILGYSWEEIAESNGVIPCGEGDQIYHCGILRTLNEGCSWEPGGDVFVNVPKGIDSLDSAISGADEPAYVELDDRSLYLLVRTGTDHLWETRSTNGGISWNEPKPSALVSHNCPAALLRLDDGNILVIYNDHPKARARLCARISSDGCRTWSEPKVFAPAGFYEEPTANYPVACQLKNGVIVVIWSQRRNSNATDKQQICWARFNQKWLQQ
jgi:hypothetical protein